MRHPFLIRPGHCLAVLLLLLAFGLAPDKARAADATSEDWNLAVLDQLLASVPAGESFVQVGDMEISVSYLQWWRNKLAGGPQPKIAFSGTFNKWTGGNVYYQFDASVSASNQRAFLDAATEWATFANLHFIARMAEANYLLVTNNASLGGGNSFVGMIGGPQLFQIGPNAWNRGTLCHELGHALGLVHEHQRSDRDSFVTIVTNNIPSGSLADFVKLTDSNNQSPYDFLSVMHYARNTFSVNVNSNTIVPLPGYSQFLNVIGHSDPVLSAADRAGMAAMYGAGPGATNVVTNTKDGGSGSLRAAMYYAFDHPGTTITFNIPTSDAGFSNSVFNILPTDAFPSLVNAMTLDGSTEPTNSNPAGPEILLNGALCQTPSIYASGLQFKGTNCAVRSFIINNFETFGVLLDGSNTVGNTVSGCYLGIDPTGTVAVTNGIYPVQISGGAISNTLGGTTVAARNVIGGSAYLGVLITDAGTRFNTVAGNYIGVNPAGNAAIGNNGAGIFMNNGTVSNVVSGNVISGNHAQGIYLTGPGTSGNVVKQNFIGLNAAGDVAISNAWAGAEISGGASANIIGDGNVISGNGNDGVIINGTTGNVVRGNFIGLNAAGNAAIGNGWAGVHLYYGAQFNQIGGGIGFRNFISGNGLEGVRLEGTGTTANLVQGNTIGLDAGNSLAVPNSFAGIVFFGGSTGNLVGGFNTGVANLISGNPSVGVGLFDAATTNNTVRGNSIFANGGYAIYLSGANNSLGAPTLSSAAVTTNTTVTGIYTGASGAVYQLDFYADASTEAMTYLGSTNITGTGGSVGFTAKLGARLPTGRIVTATATDPAGNTSMLSGGKPATITSTPNDGIPDAWRLLYFGSTSTNSSSYTGGDPDHDGQNNYQEFLAGTNPTNAASVLRLTALNPNVSTNAVSLNSANGIVYRMQYRDSLTAGGWSILADQVIGNGTNIFLPDPDAAAVSQRFYRAQVLW